MHEVFKIDSTFISTWHPKYDESESDEAEYKNLVAQIRNEINRKGSFSKETFIQVLDWKSPRVKGIARLNEYPVYETGIADAVRAGKEQKLHVLCQLHGIGAPVGSTLLHLMYPTEFPIIDIRTVETLHYAGLLKSHSTDIARYPAFKAAILKLASELPAFSLREIDRALFACHKMYLAPKSKQKKIGAPVPRYTIQTRTSNLTTREKVQEVFKGQVNRIFLREEIIDMVVLAYPETKRKSVIPSDYCYNMINADPSSFKLHGFVITSDRKYKWLGPNAPYTGPIYWKAEQVGQWERGQCQLRKDPRKH